VIVASSRRGLLPADSERRMLNFTELVATAIADAESRTQLAASRARIVAASDEARRGVERDLHDGVQQRLVSLALEVRAAQSALPPSVTEVRSELARVVQRITGTLDELREISHGIHPAILSEGGLGAAVKTLARRAPRADPGRAPRRCRGRAAGRRRGGWLLHRLGDGYEHGQARAGVGHHR
jgi:signal transduction histidine kinase